MRVLPQIFVSTTTEKRAVYGVKTLIVTAGSFPVLFAYETRLIEQEPTDWFEIPANTTYKFIAPKGKLFYMVFCKVESGSSTLDVVALDEDVEVVG